MRRNVNRKFYNDRKKCNRDTALVRVTGVDRLKSSVAVNMYIQHKSGVILAAVDLNNCFFYVNGNS